MRILEYLIDQGAIIDHRTPRCRITALEWSRNLRRTRMIRTLELASTVQRHVRSVFTAVSCGDVKRVEKLIDFNLLLGLDKFDESRVSVSGKHDITDRMEKVESEIQKIRRNGASMQVLYIQYMCCCCLIQFSI
jgi:hypothetical protein